MSRIGLQKINFLSPMNCVFDEASNSVEIKFSEKVFRYILPKSIGCKINDFSLRLYVYNCISNCEKRLLGLHRSLLNNLIVGLQVGFKKHLVLKGVGYKAEVKDNYLNIFVGYTHSIKYFLSDDLKVSCVKGNEIILESFDKQLLGVTLSELCNLRKYDPYKGKGLILKDKKMLRKESNKK